MKLSIENRFELARGELTACIMKKADALMGKEQYRKGYVAVPGLKQPSSLPDLASTFNYARNQARPVPVLADHSERTIYLFPEANHAFRFWHDVVHINMEKGFSLPEELAVAELHCKELMHSGCSEDARLLLWIDTALQAQHFYFMGGFIDNQLDWAKTHFTRLTSP